MFIAFLFCMGVFFKGFKASVFSVSVHLSVYVCLYVPLFRPSVCFSVSFFIIPCTIYKYYTGIISGSVLGTVV